MKRFDDVMYAYLTADNGFATEIEREREAGRIEIAAELERLRRLNDQAYFVLIVAEFEQYVSDLALRRVEDGRRGQYGDRRVCSVLWQRIGEDITKLSFLDRVALLMDKGRFELAELNKLYRTRSEIAHGRALSAVVDVPNTARTVERIASLLQDAP